MKHKFFLLLAVVAASFTTTYARTWRINPYSNHGAQYNSFEQLLSSGEVAEGDTIVCDPGEYGNVDITCNNLTIIGPGYFLGENGSFANTASAVFGNIRLCSGSKIEGLYVSGSVLLCDSNIEIDRCYLQYGITKGVNSGIAKCVITNNYINGSIEGLWQGNSNGFKFTENIIRNNIITGSLTYIHNSEIANNTIVTRPMFDSSNILYWIEYCNIHDNVIINTRNATYCVKWDNYYFTGNTFAYNVLSIPESEANSRYDVGNKYCGATVESTFVNEGSTDGMYKLRDDSPAKGAASNGGDCGAFGGAMPYVLSGLPRYMPQIVDVNVPDAPVGGKLNVKFTIRTQND